MKKGKAFELLVERILIHIGFSNVYSDGIYIYNGVAGKMIQGLGEAHNADVLLEPPVQIPFYIRSRLLVECKDRKNRVGLDVIRNALGLREYINHFNVVDQNKLFARQKQRRGVGIDKYRYWYQIAVASVSGYTTQAQEFAAAHRIALIEFTRYPFWKEFQEVIRFYNRVENIVEEESCLIQKFDEIGKNMALAITDYGQMLFLYHCGTGNIHFPESKCSITYEAGRELWKLSSGNEQYCFQLPKTVMESWLRGFIDELSEKQKEKDYNGSLHSNMVVYFRNNELPEIKKISIAKEELEKAYMNVF